MSPLRAVTLAFMLVAAGRTSAHAQAIAECPSPPCDLTSTTPSSPALAQVWRDVAAVHQIKLKFVDALQRFLRAQAGTFGDEGAALADSVAAMRDTLSLWDRSIGQLRTRAQTAADADAHVALATVWLDRYRLDDALRELTAAERIASDRVDVQTLRALALGALGRTQDAARSLQRAVALDPDHAAAYYMLAQYQTRLGRSEDAANAWRGLARALQHRRTTRRDGDGVLAPFERVDLLRQTSESAPIFPQSRYAAGISALRSGDYEGAIAKLAEAIEGDPLVTTSAAVHDRVVAGAAALRSGGLDGALQQLRVAAAEWPSESEIHRLLGVALWIGGQQGNSIEHLRTAMTLAPGDERARVALADVLVDERRLAEAERELKTAPAASGQTVYRLAQIYQRQSLLPQAVTAIRDSESFGPVIGRDNFYQTWGSLLVNQADFDGAVSQYSRRIEVNPNSGEAHRQLGEIYVLQGRHDEALAELSVATWIAPNDAKAYAATGQVYARLLKYPEAITALMRALMLDPSLREARYALGTVLMRVGRTAEAKTELETFGRQQADAEARGQREFEIDALRRQAAAHALAGDLAQAVAKYEDVVRLDPQSGRSHRDLGVTLLRARRGAEAIEHLQQAQRLEATAEDFALLANAHAAAGNADESARMRAAYQEAQRRATLDRIRGLSR